MPGHHIEERKLSVPPRLLIARHQRMRSGICSVDPDHGRFRPIAGRCRAGRLRKAQASLSFLRRGDGVCVLRPPEGDAPAEVRLKPRLTGPAPGDASHLKPVSSSSRLKPEAPILTAQADPAQAAAGATPEERIRDIFLTVQKALKQRRLYDAGSKFYQSTVEVLGAKFAAYLAELHELSVSVTADALLTEK